MRYRSRIRRSRRGIRRRGRVGTRRRRSRSVRPLRIGYRF